MANGTLRTISEAFEDEGFGLSAKPDSRTGERRALFEAYDQGIDWSDPSQVARANRVFETILSWGVDDIRRLGHLFNEDGYTLGDELRIRPKRRDMPALRIEHIGDVSAIEEHLERLDAAIEDDPVLAISAAKALIEATSKTILERLGEPYDDKAKIPALVKKVQTALKVHPDSIAPTKRGHSTIVRVLGNLFRVAVGVAELRNEYGPDHGRARSSSGIGPRHARLAAGAARTYCEFLLETMSDRTVQDRQSKLGSTV